MFRVIFEAVGTNMCQKVVPAEVRTVHEAGAIDDGGIRAPGD